MEIQQNDDPYLPQRLAGLGALANNLWWSWNPAARMLFKTLDRQAWKESVHNPDKMLKKLPKEILDAAAENQDYLRQYDVVLSQFNKYMESIGVNKSGTFDSRAFILPDNEIPNYFLWRMKDWNRNSIQMFARSFFSQKQLQNKNISTIHDMLHEKGKNWAKLKPNIKNGSIFIKKTGPGNRKGFDF